MLKTAIDYWSEKLGLDRDEKTVEKRMKLREAKRLERQSRYGNKLGGKAVKNQRRKQKQMDRIVKGND
jgi:hypothetical protein